MKIRNLKIMIIVTIFVLTSIMIGIQKIGAATSDVVTVTPTNPGVGDTITIQYNTAEGSLSTSITTLYLQWAFMFNGNLDTIKQTISPVPPSKIWYPANSTAGYAGRFISSKMTNISATIWEINIMAQDDLPDSIQFYFSVNADGLGDKDNNGGNYWLIEPQFAADYVYIIDPSFAETNFYNPGGTMTIKVRGNTASTGWTVSLGGRSTDPITLSVTSSTYDAVSKLWTLSASIPASFEVGLYDLVVTASVSGTTTTDTEENCIQIVATFKDEYTIVLLGDQEMNAHPGVNYAIDGALHGGHNLSDFLSELAILNADLFVNLGSATFWGDIETMQQYREYVDLFYGLPHVYVSSHRDRFMGSEADWEYRGGGIGALDKIVGIRHKEWSYGDHYFVSIFTGDHRMDDSEIAWFDDAMSASSGAVKFGMIHDPIGYETDYNPGEINAIDYDGRIQLAPICKDNDLDYWIHTSAGIDGSQEVTQTGAFHIGMAGATAGYRVLKISSDVITDWGYDASVNGLYPWYKLKTNFTGTNDGTETSASVTINNSLTEDLSAARVVFKMVPGVYSVDIGTIYSQFTQNGITYVEVNVPVAAGTGEEVSVNKIAELPTSTVPTTTSVTNTTTDTTTTTADSTPAFGFFIFAFTLVNIIISKRKKSRK